MKCPRCNVELSFQKKRCDNCGQDLKNHRLVLSMSNRLYNQGLEQAKVRDLSGAIVSLKKSLRLWKKNTNARNLLGLIYFEVGEVVSALGQWVISKHFQEEHNEADYYIQQIQSNPNRLESYNQMVKKYNTALRAAQNGDEDMAVIQLKKVVAMNPKYVKAHQLLALLYIHAGRRDNRIRAYKLMRSISHVDVTNTTTLTYLKELDDVRVKRETPRVQKKMESVEEKVKRTLPQVDPAAYQQITPYKEEKPSVLPFLHVILGIVIGVVIMRFLIVPHMDFGTNSKNNETFKEYSEQLASGESSVTTLENENEQLQKKVDELTKELGNIQDGTPTDAEAVQNMYESLFAASQYNAKGDALKAAEELAKVDETTLTTSTVKKMYKQIKNTVYPVASQTYFEQGRDCYNGQGEYAGKQSYKKAIKLLLKAIDFNADNTDAMYFLGRCYQQQEDLETAKQYYNQVVNDYPDSARVAEASSRLREMGQ